MAYLQIFLFGKSIMNKVDSWEEGQEGKERD